MARREETKGIGRAKEEEEDAALVASSSLCTAPMAFLVGRVMAAVVRRTGGRVGAILGRMNAELGDGRGAAGEADDARASLERLTRAADAEVVKDVKVEVEWSGRAMCGLSKEVFVLVAGTAVGVMWENGERGRGARGWMGGMLLGRRRYLARLEKRA